MIPTPFKAVETPSFAKAAERAFTVVLQKVFPGRFTSVRGAAVRDPAGGAAGAVPDGCIQEAAPDGDGVPAEAVPDGSVPGEAPDGDGPGAAAAWDAV